MSIKGFHLIFITIAALFSAALGVWALFVTEEETGPAITAFGVICLIFSLILIAYGIHFRRKSKDIIV